MLYLNVNKEIICKFILWFSLSLAIPCQAARYPLEGEYSLIGDLGKVVAIYKDTLSDIARNNGLGISELKLANPGLDHWLPGEGMSVLLPTQFLLPDSARDGLVLNIPEMRLYYFPPGQQDTVITHPLGIGRAGWETPYIQTQIIEKKPFPSWHPPESIRREHEQAGDPLPRVVEPGPDNPLGEYAMRLGQPEYLIHGTNQPWGVGMRVSHGCIRMYPEDIKSLFQQVGLKTRVNIVNQPYKVGKRGGMIYLEAHPYLDEDKQEFRNNLLGVIHAIEEQAAGQAYELDIARATETIRNPTGYPVQVGFYLPVSQKKDGPF